MFSGGREYGRIVGSRAPRNRGTFADKVLSTIYAAIARRRREYYAARPHLRRRLRRPVISIGNLAMGGRGKTPVVATVTRLLMEQGERPAILSRGYARRSPEPGVVVVRDREGIRADVDRAGDEPLMLARQLPGASVLVSADRYLAGCLAERHLDATVHVLDDGFQHLQLDRDVDLVIVDSEDLQTPETVPSGRLREPLDALAAADAILATGDGHMSVFGGRRGEEELPVFPVRRRIGVPAGVATSTPVFALAGIARPERFFGDLRTAGWDVRGTRKFADHHAYSPRDLFEVIAAARASRAEAILTTEKDLVRVLPFRPFSMPVAFVPLTMEPDPLHEFSRWLTGSVAAARDLILD